MSRRAPRDPAGFALGGVEWVNVSVAKLEGCAYYCLQRSSLIAPLLELRAVFVGTFSRTGLSQRLGGCPEGALLFGKWPAWCMLG